MIRMIKDMKIIVGDKNEDGMRMQEIRGIGDKKGGGDEGNTR